MTLKLFSRPRPAVACVLASAGRLADLSSAQLGDLAAGRRTGEVSAGAARAELDRRAREAQQILCMFMDRVSAEHCAARSA